MDGFLNINKPRGLTSFDVIRKLRKILKIRKMGHSGNLDPGATGVLVIGVNKGTRFLEYILNLEKEYVATIQLGVLTDTLDMDGNILEEKEVPVITQSELEAVLEEFTGEIEQVPPSYSAIKKGGKRLYELAREGVFVVPKARKVYIYSIELLEFQRDSFKIKVVCSSGTYIRSLARDIALRFNTYGCVKNLVRTRIGHFKIENSIDLENEEKIKKSLIPVGEGLSFMASVTITNNSSFYFRNGNKVPQSAIIKRSHDARSFSLVRVFDQSGDFLGVGMLKWDGVYPKKVLTS